MKEPTLLIVGPHRRRAAGRRPIYGERASSRLVVRITNEQKNDLADIAREEGRDVAIVVRDAVDEYVADYRERKVFNRSTGRYQPE